MAFVVFKHNGKLLKQPWLLNKAELGNLKKHLLKKG